MRPQYSVVDICLAPLKLASFPRTRTRLLVLAGLSVLITLAGLLTVGGPVEGTTATATVKVSSLGQAQSSRMFVIEPDKAWAHSFCTGSYETTLDKVRIYTRMYGGSVAPTVAIHRGAPGTVLETLTNPSTIDGNLATAEDFTSSGVTLAPNTRYYVSFSLPSSASGGQRLVIGTTDSTDEDSNTEAGWEISDFVALFKSGPHFWAPILGHETSHAPSHSRFRMAVYASQAASTDGRPAFHDYPCNGSSGLYYFEPLENIGDGALVGTVEARDPGSDTLTYSVSGRDATAFNQAFTIGANNGEIRVKADGNFNYERQAPYAEPYRVVVSVTDGKDSSGNAETPALTDISGEVTIKVINVKEPGFVTFSTSTPQVGVAITGTLADDDGVYPYDRRFRMPRWQWSKSDTADGTFVDIAGATGKSYTPVTSDLGKFLMADVLYHDYFEPFQRAKAKITTAVAAEPPLTASLREAPSSHNGSSSFVFQVAFSSVLSNSSKSGLPAAFTITGGRIIRSWTTRHNFGAGEGFVALVSPSGNANFNVSLPATTNCSNSGAVCSKYGANLSNSLMFTVTGPGTGNHPPNNLATGAPSITGTARVDETLTASTSGIADIDGLTNATFSYQWVRNDGTTDTDISGATGSTYILVDADEGKTIKVKVSFTDDAGNSESLTSAATAEVAAALGLEVSSATVDGTTLTLNFNETLDDGVTLPTSAFSVSVGGTAVTVSSVSISGSALSLTLSTAAASGDTVTVSYTRPSGAHFIRDTRGREADSFSDLAVTNNTTRNITDRADNNPATGAPTITGTAQVGETLTASTSGIADTDGLTKATFAYQWVRNDGTTDTDISGATTSTYTLVDADEGKTVKVTVSFNDDSGNAESLTSAATATVAAAPPPLTASVHDEPSNHDGSSVFTFELRFSENIPISYRTLQNDAFTITGGDVVKARRLEAGKNVRWEINVEPSGDGTVTVTLPATTDCDDEGAICAEDGRMLSSDVVVTVRGPGSQSETQNAETSNAAATGAPSISGTARVGETLTSSTSGIADTDGLTNATFSYQWIRRDSGTDANISGATSSTYTLAEADEGKTVKVTVSFTDDRGNAESLTSAATASVQARPNTAATGAPSISGTARVGETLTASTSGIADTDGLDDATFSYQWVRRDGTTDTDISGATSSTYTLAEADEGKTVKVRVSFTDDRGHAEALTSAATATVSAALSPLTASVHDEPSSHDGSSTFAFELRFSETPADGFSYRTLRDHAFTATGGDVVKARRLEAGKNVRWEISVEPSGEGTVIVTLPATTDCDSQGAICAEDGRMLSGPVVVTVRGPGS